MTAMTQWQVLINPQFVHLLLLFVTSSSVTKLSAFSPTPKRYACRPRSGTHSTVTAPHHTPSSTSLPSSTPLPTTSNNTNEPTNNLHLRQQLTSSLLSRFRGDFDNYRQVLSDRRAGRVPREGGGHEHFHCTFLPLPHDQISFGDVGADGAEGGCEGAVIAAYYLDAAPRRLFRLRMYAFFLDPAVPDDDGGGGGDGGVSVGMKLYNLSPDLEREMRETSVAPLEHWDRILRGCFPARAGGGDGDGAPPAFVELERCDIRWSTLPDPVRHTYLNVDGGGVAVRREDRSGQHAIMAYDHEKGGVRLNSQMTPGTYIRVQDELSMWEDQLWLNDRGFDAETGERIYGNWLDDPYRMERLSNVTMGDEGLQTGWKREVSDSALAWTLGEKWRTEDEYAEKMDAIGGPSSRNTPKK